MSNADYFTNEWSYPRTLQFAAYVGELEGFNPSDSHTSTSFTEVAWQQWWLELPNAIVVFDDVLQQAIIKDPSLNSTKHNPSIVKGSDMGDFASLRNDPTLRKLCQQYNEGFRDLWDRSFTVKSVLQLTEQRQNGYVGSFDEIAQQYGEKLAFSVAIEEQKRRLILSSNLQENDAISQKIKENKRYLLFVRWPQNYAHTVTSNLIVLGSDYLKAGNLNDLRKVIDQETK